MDNLFYELPPAAQKALLEGPAIPPPPGIVPNFSHPPSHREIGWVVAILCLSLSVLAVAVRMYARIVCDKRVRIEDYLIITALGVYSSFQYFTMRMAIYPGFFVHSWDIPLKALSGLLYDIAAGSAIQGIVFMLLKVAILVDLLRIFSPRGQRNLFFWTSHILLWANIVFYTTCTFLEVFSCQPREKRWNKLMPGGHCINVYALTVTVGSINFASDICILLLPQSIIWRLTMATPKKIGISAIFAVAIFACVTAAARLAYSVPLLHGRDLLYRGSYAVVWIEAEMAAGFLILGFPAVPGILKSSPKLQRFLSRIKSWSGSSAGKVKVNARKGLPSWYKPGNRRKPPREPGWSDLENTQDSMCMQRLGDLTA